MPGEYSKSVPGARPSAVADSADRPPFPPPRAQIIRLMRPPMPGTNPASGRDVTAPRPEVRGATMALSRRTNFRKAMLAPWHQLVDRIWWYSLAWAQQRTGVAVH